MFIGWFVSIRHVCQESRLLWIAPKTTWDVFGSAPSHQELYLSAANPGGGGTP